MTVAGTVSVLLVLGLCVLFHEAGHFVLAKLAGMKVEEFALGFGRRLLGFRVGETVYKVNLVPLGGYVRIAGMEPGESDQERGFYRFPRWQGATVLLAGSVMNVVLAALAFAGVAVFSGLPVFPDRAVEITAVIPGGPASEADLRPGDQILAIDRIRHSLFVEEVTPGGPAEQAGVRRYTWIYRHGSEDLAVPGDLLRAMQATAAAASDTTSAGGDEGQAAAGEKTGDAIVVASATYDHEGGLVSAQELRLPIPRDLPAQWQEAQAAAILERSLGMKLAPLDHGAASSYIAAHPNEPITLTILRAGQVKQVRVTPRTEWARVMIEDERGRLTSTHKQVGRIGVVVGGMKERAPLPKAMLYGVMQSWAAIKMVVGGLAMMAAGEIAPDASGPVGIAAMTADRARMGWAAVASLGGVISANLAVINLFPIPPFDGFRLVLLAVEGILRRRVSHKVELALTITGVAVILGLFMIITFRDIFNLLLYNTP